MLLDEHEVRPDGSVLYTCQKGCFEADHPLIKRMGQGKMFALFYYAGLPE